MVGGCSEPRSFFLPKAKVTLSQITVSGYGPQREQTMSPGNCCSFTKANQTDQKRSSPMKKVLSASYRREITVSQATNGVSEVQKVDV